MAVVVIQCKQGAIEVATLCTYYYNVFNSGEAFHRAYMVVSLVFLWSFVRFLCVVSCGDCVVLCIVYLVYLWVFLVLCVVLW